MCLPGKACLPGVDENPEGHRGKGGLAAGDSPQTSMHFLFSLQQVCWSLAYLQRRLTIFGVLGNPHEYFCPGCTVTTHTNP